MGSGRKKRNTVDALSMDSDENFAFIAGYTSWGFPYGITWEEMEKIKRDEMHETLVDEADMKLPFD